MTIGNRIQLVRKAAGLSQKELGKKMGVSGSMIGQYENDLRKPKRETLEKIAAALNVSWEDLAGEETLVYTHGTHVQKMFDRIVEEVAPREAIHTLLKNIYGRFEGKVIEDADGEAEAVYYLVGKGDDEFFLSGHDMTDILELVLKFLRVVVEPMKLTGPEKVVRDAYQAALKSIKNPEGQKEQG